MRRYLPALWFALQFLAMILLASAFVGTPAAAVLGLAAIALYVAASASCLWVACRRDAQAPRDVVMAWLPGLPVYAITAVVFSTPDWIDDGAMVALPLMLLLLGFALASTIATAISVKRSRQSAHGPRDPAPSDGPSSKRYLPAVWLGLLSTACVLAAPHASASAFATALNWAASLLWLIASILSWVAYRRVRATSHGAETTTISGAQSEVR